MRLIREQAIHRMLKEDDFFESTLALLELEESNRTVSFLTKLLEQNPGREKDQSIRKALYRLRQKGFEPPRREIPVITVEPDRSEIFLLAENRLPFWQAFFTIAAPAGVIGFLWKSLRARISTSFNNVVTSE